MGLYSARNIPLFAIIASPILSGIAANNLSNSSWKVVENNLLKTDKNLRGAMWIIISVLAALVLMSTPVMRDYNRFNKAIFPVDAVNWLEKNPQEGRAFNYFTWGGYLLYRQWPKILVFIDGQTDFYGETLTREYEQIISTSPGWENTLNKYEIQWAIIPTRSNLASVLSVKGWEALYQDETAVILENKTMP